MNNSGWKTSVTKIKKFTHKFSFVLIILPICISLMAAFISYKSLENGKKTTYLAEKNYKEALREKEPDLKIIQNLWTTKPRYELINESNSKLDRTPSPSYLMFVPSKMLYFKDGELIGSNLILSVISYDMVTEQIVGNQTKDSIITTYLPENFYAKKGINDIIYSEKIEIEGENEMEIRVSTFPFLVIVSDVNYQYKEKEYNKIILSTPLLNEELNRSEYTNIVDYVKDTANYLKVNLNEDESIYSTVQQNVEEKITTLFSDPSDKEIIKILGGKEGGYGNTLKKLNKIITPVDPIAGY